jgi:hypothetical protein
LSLYGEASPSARVWDIIERVGVCMLTTHTSTGLRARPLEARPDRGNGIIWFVTDLRSRKKHEIVEELTVGRRAIQLTCVRHPARADFLHELISSWTVRRVLGQECSRWN